MLIKHDNYPEIFRLRISPLTWQTHARRPPTSDSQKDLSAGRFGLVGQQHREMVELVENQKSDRKGQMVRRWHKMGRGQILNSIPDLQIEYGGQYGAHSIRDFLISVKGFSERQYRHIIAHVPASEWHVRRGEIQNSIAANKIERLTEEALEINHRFVETARVGLFKAMQFMAKAGDPSNGGLTPEELLNCLKSVQATQEVFMRAMGVKKGEGLTQIFESIHKRTERFPAHKKPSSKPSEVPDLSYDDVMTLIEIKRERKSARAQNNL